MEYPPEPQPNQHVGQQQKEYLKQYHVGLTNNPQNTILFIIHRKLLYLNAGASTTTYGRRESSVGIIALASYHPCLTLIA